MTGKSSAVVSYDMEKVHVEGYRCFAMNCISGQIETLRKELLETVDRNSGNFLHPHVLRISQELDLLIVRVQQSRLEERRLSNPLNQANL
jgi:hypothetical protein